MKNTENNHEILITKALEKVNMCEQTLDKISSICCMPIRSVKMKDTFKALEHLKEKLSSEKENVFSSSISDIEDCGSAVGKLYVSCCTDQRELLYQELLKGLNEIHTIVHKVMGVGH